MLPSGKRVSVTLGILVGMFLAALEMTVVGTAMPTIVSSLGGLEIYSWVFSAYLLTSTVTVPIWGKLSDLHGRRLLYMFSVGLFLFGSILSGLARSMSELIVFRAVQGLGAGGLLPIGMTIIGELYTPVERARIQGFFSGVWGVASILGPLAGGFLTDQLNWRWVFYINIPFGLIAALIIGTQLKEDLSQHKRAHLDFFGISLFTLAMSLLMILLVRSETSFDFRSPVTALLLAGTTVSLLLFIRAERRAQEPLLPVELFHNKVFTGATLNGFLAGTAMFGLLSFIPLFVQGVQGTGATEAGSVLTPLLLGWVIFSAVGGRLLLRFTFRQVMFAGTFLMLCGFLALDVMTAETSRTVVLRNSLMLGSGMGLTMITSMIAVQDSVSRRLLGIATSTSQFFRSIGGAIGVAIMGTVMIQRMNHQVATASEFRNLREFAHNPDVFLQPATRDSMSPALVSAFQHMLANALHSVFIVGTVICFVALIGVFLMPSLRLTSTSGKGREDLT
jgi:EmrB/QacA subfamily drug resistance transporter